MSEEEIPVAKFEDQLHKMVSEIRGNEMKIIDDFCKSFLAAESLLTGKDFVTLMREFSLNVQYCNKNGQPYAKYWLSLEKE